MSIDLPAFTDPVLDAQATFRAVLTAMSRPGTLHAAGASLTPPTPLDRATAAVLLTLVDAETVLFLGDGFSPAEDWIRFHCGALITGDAAGAGFLLTDTLPDLADLNQGSDEGPDQSATVILQVRGFDAGQRLILAGPGLRTTEPLTVDGLPDHFVDAWTNNHAMFPRGIDLILCAGTTLTALPRSVRIIAPGVS